MRSIFISYRRNDTEGEAGRLFDDLVSEFGENSVFMDVAAIEAGRDFRKVIDESIANCGVLLAIIGKNWVDAKDDNGSRRLDDPTDFVRLETASALRRDIPVIPVLVRGSKMPRAEDLPGDLHDLAYRNCVELTHARWGSDLELLVTALRRQLKIEKSGPLVAVTELAGGASATSRPEAAADFEPTVQAVPQPTSSPGHKNPLTFVIAAAIGIVAIGLGAYFFANRQVTVPDLRGDTIALATSKLQSSHLKIGQTTVRQDSTVDPNLVLSQYPPSDERVKSGTAIDLVVSGATAQVEVPTITGQTLDNALHTLAEHQLVVGDVQRQARAGVARDTILQQFPQAGEMVKVNGKIDVLVSDLPPAETPTPSTANAGQSADADWAKARAAERAAAKQAALKAAAARAAAANGAAGNPAPTQPAATADTGAPKVVIRSVSCKTLSPGKYRLDIMGDATVAPLDTYLFYTWASIGNAGTRWRPECKGWSTPTAADDSLWDVSCIHRSSDPPQMSWQTSRIITSQNNQPPTTGGTTLFKPGMQAQSSLKFSVTCQ